MLVVETTVDGMRPCPHPAPSLTLRPARLQLRRDGNPYLQARQWLWNSLRNSSALHLRDMQRMQHAEKGKCINGDGTSDEHDELPPFHQLSHCRFSIETPGFLWR